MRRRLEGAVAIAEIDGAVPEKVELMIVIKVCGEYQGRGSRKTLLARLTEQSTGLPVIPGEVEGSTLGNFAVQLAALDGAASGAATAPAADLVRSWASYLSTTTPEPQSIAQ